MKKIAAYLALILLALSCGRPETGSEAGMYPDYRDVTVPCNIAPLNFSYEGTGGKTVLSAPGVKFSTRGRSVRIPLKRWHKLLEAAKGSEIEVSGPLGKWSIFVCEDSVDEYLTYRLIEPGYEVWDRVEIRERRVSDFSERVLCDWRNTQNSCMNCHTHKGGNSIFYIRGSKGGAVLNTGGQIRYLSLKADGMLSGTVYGDLHPSGRWGVFSTNVIIPGFHTLADRRMEVYDTASDLTVADFEGNRMLNAPAFTREDKFETFPCFSADGSAVFFCSADTLSLPDGIEDLRYSLVKTSFNAATGELGPGCELIWDAAEHNGSVCHPKASPDGRWLLYTVADYGTFPIWHRECHLELMDLETGDIRSLEDLHSNASDSYHSWSSDSRWFVFASKRGDGQYGKPYFCHIADNGTPSKPFVLPQKDPEHYLKTLKSFNMPDLGTFPAPYDAKRTGQIWQNTETEKFTDSKQKNATFSRLEAAARNGQCMYAMQDALSYGQGWHPESIESDFEQCDIKAVTGDYPAITGFDLGGIELGDECNLDGVNFEYMKNAAIAHAARGGIVTFSWHTRNPLTGGDAWDVSSDKVVEAVLPGGAVHEKFIGWLGKLADFLLDLKDSEGKSIPIIFRPWHENTGSWFWWGEDLCTDEQYVALWQMTYDYLVTEKGLEDMLWAYSPSSSGLKEYAMGRYPGDSITDIIGVDRYATAHEKSINPSYISGMQSDLEFLGKVAGERGLLLAVTETGQEGQDCPLWWTRELLPAIEGHPVCYVLTWRNAWDEAHPGHWFSTFPGAANEEDFIKFHNSSKTLFLNDIRK